MDDPNTSKPNYGTPLMRRVLVVLFVVFNTTSMRAASSSAEIKRGGELGADCVLHASIDPAALDDCVNGAKRQALVANTASSRFKLGLFFEAMIGAITLYKESPSGVTKSSVLAYAAEVTAAENEVHITDRAVARILQLTSPAAASALKDARDLINR